MIAFGARKLRADDDGPKYLNTPETPLFKKSSVLYGADLARREISQRRQAVLVEGYTDVMACHMAGIGTAVATSGTSFGEGHVSILRRLLMDSDKFLGEVIFTFDGDAAGQRAAVRAFSLEERFVTQTFVAVQPDGLDPCDLRLARGDAAVRDLIAQRVPVYEFVIRTELAKHNLETNEGRLAALDDAAAIVGQIKDRGLRDRYAISVDRWLGMMDENFVLERVRQHARPRPAAGMAGTGTGPSAAGRPAAAMAAAAAGRAAPCPSRATARGMAAATAAWPATTSGTPRTGSSGKHSSWPCSDRRCAGRPSTRSGPPASPSRCTWRRSRSSRGAAAPRRRPAPASGLSSCAARHLMSRSASSSPSSPSSRCGLPARTPSRTRATSRRSSPGSGSWHVSREIARVKSKLQRMNPVTEQAEYGRLFGDLVALEQRRKVLSGPAADALQ